MLRNYILVSFRNLRKHLTYSVINVVGLGLGLATCLLLVTWIRHETSYDRFHKHADRLYRASLEYSFGGQTSKTSVSPTALLPAVQKNFAEVETGVRVYNPSYYSPFIVKVNDQLFQERKFYFADSTFFDVFTFRVIDGSPEHALTQPRSIVLTESLAKKYFGDTDAMGKTILVNGSVDYTVTGIMADAPANSLLQFDCVASFSSLDAAKEQIWWSANYQTFVILAPHASPRELQDKTNALVKKELASELTNAGDYVHYNFVPMTDIYLHSDMQESEATSSIYYIYGFGGIAIIILLIACINYINLSTAKASDRAREVGIRKVIGAVKKQLFLQFIGESTVITFFAFVLAFGLVLAALPLFNALTGKHFSPALFTDPWFLLSCLAGLIGIAFVAGIYPALAMSAFKPITVLKGNFRSSGRGIWLRQCLVVFQFCISIILMVGTIVILKQINFIHDVRIGYDKENVVVLPLDRKSRDLYGPLRTEILRTGKAVNVGRATESPTKILGGYSISLQSADQQGMIVTAMDADTSFVPALGMEIVAGRNFNDADVQKFRADTTVAFILNESAIKALLLARDKAVGTRVKLNGRKGEIVGVVKDFHFASLHSPIGPLVLFQEGAQLNYIFVKLKPGDIGESLAALKKVCLATLPHRPFEFEFLDQKYAALYSSEQRIGTIISVFAGLAIAIACLGLLGLVAFAASQKTKEIGIRKVMGATALNIVLLITKDYFRLVVISILIGVPLAYLAIEKWFLGSFAYRTTIGLWPLALAAVSCVAVAFITASYQAVKAAYVNPSDTLRSE